MALTYAAITAKTLPAQHNTRTKVQKKSTVIIVHKNGNVSNVHDKALTNKVTNQVQNDDLEEVLREGARDWEDHRVVLQAMINDISDWINTPAPEAQATVFPNIWNDGLHPRTTNPYTFDPFGNDSYFSLSRSSRNASTRSSLVDLHLEYPDTDDQMN